MFEIGLYCIADLYRDLYVNVFHDNNKGYTSQNTILKGNNNPHNDINCNTNSAPRKIYFLL